jgi:hypothetical protein
MSFRKGVGLQLYIRPVGERIALAMMMLRWVKS